MNMYWRSIYLSIFLEHLLYFEEIKGGLLDHVALCVSVCPPNVARQRRGKYIPAAMNTHTTVEKLLDAVFTM
jgi:hypothetical protein